MPPEKQFLGEASIRTLLRRACVEAGGIRQWAEANGESYRTTMRYLNGAYPIGAALARKFGFEPVRLFRRVDRS